MHVAVEPDVAAALLAAVGDDAALDRLVEEIEEGERHADAVESDKAWDPILCALSPDGYDRTARTWPAHGVVLGGRTLNEDEDAGLITLLTPPQVDEVDVYLRGLTEDGFGVAYDAMHPDLRNPEFGADERGYAWQNLEDLRAFFERVARVGGLHVLFTVSF
jgi:hypothetical protein